ncbi:hypothetical protein K450DRAFT_243163 [Umbelopsis ramanniana AG]|uniref:PCI domain-containing protein n=1 Tax=Umbelopsis ramanniana AG TaxID=1314678 RepID=A0AAD5E9K6_UMBRA|nr:uncharacterized protein K450DRAFT_243163 [Umbelopsis ramanniana AG]KAI8579184.1 hypothetical protein K450DRAFT_243163 [Umbelopsis ramanniana AG]
MQRMDVDLDVPAFLNSEKQNVPSNLQHYYVDFEDLYDRKLWHQLTQKVLEYLNEPESGPYQISLFQKFVVDWESKINKLSLVYIGLTTARKFTELQDSVNFLSEIITKVDTPETKDAYVYAVMEAAYFKLLMGQTEETKKAIDECEKILDQFDSVETVIYASFYRVSAEYFKAEADYAQYYKGALLYLACIDINKQLTKKEREDRAFDLAIAALLGNTIYNFGELLMHPILDSWTGTEHEWLRTLLFAFNAGDIGKFESLAGHFSELPVLQQNLDSLSRKICLMSLIEAVFKRSGDNRSIPFSDIAAETRLPNDEVEHLVMKALSLNLIRGSIDQVDQTVNVTWVQPRVLDRDQIDGMRKRLDIWNRDVNKIATFVQQEGGEVFAQ